jgi:hypothetical protein
MVSGGTRWQVDVWVAPELHPGGGFSNSRTYAAQRTDGDIGGRNLAALTILSTSARLAS